MTNDPRSDEELVSAARRGDAAAFEALYRRHRDWVAAVARRYGGDREDALDVLQETFLYLARRIPTLELRCQLRSFLYPAIKHLALSRRDRRRRESVVGSPPDRAADPAPDVVIDDLLRDLSEEHREVVVLRFVDGLDLQAIADALDLPLGTVKSRLHHAIRELRHRAAGWMNP